MAAMPPGVELIFSDPVTPAGAGIKVYSPSGRQIASPAISRGRLLYDTMSSTETGTFVVSWQVLAADTHPSRGAFQFSIVRPSANPYLSLLSGGQIGTATPLGLALQALARSVHFAGFALAFGVVGYQALTRRKQRLNRLVKAGVVLLIVAEPLALIGQLASLSFDADTAFAVLASGFGRLLALRLAGALLVWALWAIESPWPVIGVGVAVALVDGASAHAIPGLPGAGQLLVGMHVAAMALWVGGLAAYLADPDRRSGQNLPPPVQGGGLGRGAAAGTFAIAAISGLLLAVAHIGAVAALMTTAYGQALVIKVLIVGAAMSMVVLRRRRIEFATLLAVIAAAAVLAALPPPR
jgi:copper transport protein